jgi:hypothetical protein
MASLAFSSAARAERKPGEDYCLRESSACIEGCEEYNARFWGTSWPTPRTVACIGECTIAYVGCIMLRFREGV